MYSLISIVSRIREASRHLLRELDSLSLALAGTQDLKPSAVHAVMEIGYAHQLQARY